MKKDNYSFSYTVFESADELPKEDAQLLQQAREMTQQAYAPYSNFYVGAIAKLANGKTVSGTNQENASFPVGLCAERVLLSSAVSLFPKIPIETIAISYTSDTVKSDHPVAPCGLCRQTLIEFEERLKSPIRLILAGSEGKVFVIERASQLLPFAFTSDELQ
jgi:cytidine deaminase